MRTKVCYWVMSVEAALKYINVLFCPIVTDIISVFSRGVLKNIRYIKKCKYDNQISDFE